MPPRSAPGRSCGPGERTPPELLMPDDASSVAQLGPRSQPLTESLSELAGDLRCSPRHVEEMDRDGRLGPKSIRLGRRRVWLRSEIQTWLAAGAPDRVAWLARKEGAR